MSNNYENFHRGVVVGIDGSGKSTTANKAAELLSQSYPDSDIRIVDSNGITFYRGGEPHKTKFEGLSTLEPLDSSSKAGTVLRLAAFTIARQAAEQMFTYSPNSLTIGVRDPFRIEPATYLPVFGPEALRKISPERRLKILNRFTCAIHPSLIAFLQTDPQMAFSKSSERVIHNKHESPECIDCAANEMPKVIDAYQNLFGSRVAKLTALQTNTIDQTAMIFEEFVPNRKSITSILGSAKTARQSA